MQTILDQIRIGCSSLDKGQVLTIPPKCAWIISPGTSITSCEPVVNNVRNNEWHIREIVPSTFEAPIRGAEDKWTNSILRSQHSTTNSRMSYIVSIHELFLQPFVSLSHLLAIILLESSEGVDLIL